MAVTAIRTQPLSAVHPLSSPASSINMDTLHNSSGLFPQLSPISRKSSGASAFAPVRSSHSNSRQSSAVSLSDPPIPFAAHSPPPLKSDSALEMSRRRMEREVLDSAPPFSPVGELDAIDDADPILVPLPPPPSSSAAAAHPQTARRRSHDSMNIEGTNHSPIVRNGGDEQLLLPSLANEALHSHPLSADTGTLEEGLSISQDLLPSGSSLEVIDDRLHPTLVPENQSERLSNQPSPSKPTVDTSQQVIDYLNPSSVGSSLSSSASPQPLPTSSQALFNTLPSEDGNTNLISASEREEISRQLEQKERGNENGSAAAGAANDSDSDSLSASEQREMEGAAQLEEEIKQQQQRQQQAHLSMSPIASSPVDVGELDAALQKREEGENGMSDLVASNPFALSDTFTESLSVGDGEGENDTTLVPATSKQSRKAKRSQQQPSSASQSDAERSSGGSGNVSPHATRKRTRTEAAAQTPTFPSRTSQRLQARRNSDVASSSSSRSTSASREEDEHARLHAELEQNPFALEPSFHASATRTKQQKRKSSTADVSAIDGDAQCPCDHCAGCAQHWRSLGATADHHSDHGHIHSKSSAANEHRENFAVREGETINDTSLAMSPAFAGRKGGHHKQVKGHAYEVSRLLDVRLSNGQRQYLVSWKNYPDVFNCWQSLESLETNCSALVQQFENSLPEQDGVSDSDADEEGGRAASEHITETTLPSELSDTKMIDASTADAAIPKTTDSSDFPASKSFTQRISFNGIERPTAISAR